jgi:hypothetical protein
VKTVVYTFESTATLAAAQRLVDSGKVAAVILQRPMTFGAKLALLRRRLARFGIVRVLDEVLFQIYYRLFLSRGDDRLRKLLDEQGGAAALAKRLEEATSALKHFRNIQAHAPLLETRRQLPAHRLEEDDE